MAYKNKKKRNAHIKKRRAEDPEFAEKERARYRKYHAENREEILERNRRRHKELLAENPAYRARVDAKARRYYAENQEKQRAYNRERMRKLMAENPWISHFRAAKRRCKNQNVYAYRWYGAKGIKMLLTTQEIKTLWKRDHADQMERPSIDRINPRGDYHFGNCRFIEQSENSRRGALKTKEEQNE